VRGLHGLDWEVAVEQQLTDQQPQRQVIAIMILHWVDQYGLQQPQMYG